MLRQVSRGGSLGDDERAVVEAVQAREHFHQRGFARAVRAHQADAVVRRDQPVGVFKKKFVAEAFSGAGKLNHGLDSSSHKKRVPSTRVARDKSGMRGGPGVAAFWMLTPRLAVKLNAV